MQMTVLSARARSHSGVSMHVCVCVKREQPLFPLWATFTPTATATSAKTLVYITIESPLPTLPRPTA